MKKDIYDEDSDLSSGLKDDFYDYICPQCKGEFTDWDAENTEYNCLKCEVRLKSWYEIEDEEE